MQSSYIGNVGGCGGAQTIGVLVKAMGEDEKL